MVSKQTGLPKWVTPAQAVELGVGRPSLFKWSTCQCPRLGRAIRSKPDPKHIDWRLYLRGDVEAAAVNDGDRREEFTDSRGTWIWVQNAARDFKVGIETVRDWQKFGCPALDGKKLPDATRRFKGNPAPLHFVRREDMEQVMGIRQAPVSDDSTGNWLTRVQLWTKHRYDRHTLSKYTNQKHPVIGRRIRTIKRWVPFARSGKFERLFSAADIDEIEAQLTKLSDRPDLVSPLQEKRYGFGLENVTRWRKQGCLYLDGAKLAGEKIIVRQRSRKIMAVHWHNKAQLDTIKSVLARRREHVDSHGLWLPLKESAARVEVIPEMIVTWARKGCPHIKRTILRQRVAFLQGRSKHGGKAWVYLAADLDLVKARINGWPDPKPVAALVPARIAGHRGRPLNVTERNRRRTLSAAWDQAKQYYMGPSGGGMAKWCSEQNPPMKVSTFKGYLSAKIMQAKRSSRG
jgi:hypothetical protein